MEIVRKGFQVLLGAALIYAGITHLTTNRLEFQAQVPTWVPLSADFVVKYLAIRERHRCLRIRY